MQLSKSITQQMLQVLWAKLLSKDSMTAISSHIQSQRSRLELLVILLVLPLETSLHTGTCIDARHVYVTSVASFQLHGPQVITVTACSHILTLMP